MTFNPTVAGLILDIIGFILVFAFGGFDVGADIVVTNDDNSEEMKPFKLLGAFLVVVGFLLQIYGVIGR